MPIETDLKVAYDLLYNKKQPEEAVKLYDNVLRQSESNLVAMIYKAASLEKLYHEFKDWNKEETINEAHSLLEKALEVATSRGNRSKMALVYFRFFVHEFHRGNYTKAALYMQKAEAYGYNDATLSLWKSNLEGKLGNLKVMESDEKLGDTSSSSAPDKDGDHEPVKIRTEWYQSAQNITISLFVSKLPASSKDVKVELENDVDLTVSYRVEDTGSDFLYSITLAHPVEQSFSVKVMSKKFEITFTKKAKVQWKALESTEEVGSTPSQSTILQPNSDNKNTVLKYPSSSKKGINWDSIKIDEDEGEEQESADKFFQSIYADADPDTKRAMMKSFIESNGTALNTDWAEVSKGRVKPCLPDGTELKDV
ncbi:HBR237Cp [Eremothecium sinecaudum]|uniref:HBR237Cp n=1 Tax=Eremothecium sinecaudum TaxID=45286 RepID=A0A109UX31_9SACH|nr:HBR237Cp [Eremothecium sinecaudum]AMD19138.1 HBR237Cp [Eremothecium sinecaudum]